MAGRNYVKKTKEDRAMLKDLKASIKIDLDMQKVLAENIKKKKAQRKAIKMKYKGGNVNGTTSDVKVERPQDG